MSQNNYTGIKEALAMMSGALVIVASGLTLLLGLSFVALSSRTAVAESASASVIVPESCILTSTVDNVHSATISNGTYQDNIGTTTLKAFCNDTSGFSIYAIGYTDNTFGNNTLTANIGGTLTPAYDIATGTATGTNANDPSNWAMKLSAIDGTYAPIIAGSTNDTEKTSTTPDFSNYTTIPNTYTRVAYRNSTTDTGSSATGSSVTTTYAAYISKTQPAGTYAGQVKYTMVHPASAVPNQPQSCDSGRICYFPNANGKATYSMGGSSSNHTISTSATSTTLWASNFKRTDGYGFVGWSDKYDWVVNQNDANGNGTGVNAGYHIYGPNQDINFTAGQYTGTNPGLSLYAVWAKSQGNLQDWACPDNTIMPVGTVTALTDTRDGNTYAVAKLRDDANDATSGKCWMIENLRLGGTSPITLTSEKSNVSSDFTLPATTDPTVGDGWCTNYNAACIDKSMLASDNTTNTVNDMENIGSNIYGYGNYYNWYSVTAGTGTYSTSTNNTSVTSDICPKGWRLARGGNNQNTANNDFLALSEAVIGSKPANYDTSTYPSYTGTPEGTNASNSIRAYPNNIIYSGYAYGSSFYDRGYYGIVWSSTALDSFNAYYLDLVSSSLDPGTYGHIKHYGYTARCVVGS